MAPHIASGSRAASAGFTFVGLLFAMALLGIALATIGVVWSTQSRREREQQLLWVGDQYRLAIGRYRQQGGQLPQSLEALVQDQRFPTPRHHLRRLYPDPMTGNVDWELIQAPDGGILGVASSSHEQPIKVANFSSADQDFSDATCYCDWKFVYTPRTGRRPPTRRALVKP